MEAIRRWAPILVLIACTLGLQIYIARRLGEWPAILCCRWRKLALWLALGATCAWMVIGVPYCVRHDGSVIPSVGLSYAMAGSLLWVALVISGGAFLALRRAPFDPSKRQLLKAAAPAVAAVPLAGAGFGILIAGGSPEMREVKLQVPGLAAELDGLRIAQLTDIHYGPFFGRKELDRAVGMTNEAKPHLVVLTGDLITRRGDLLNECLGGLRLLKAEAGIFGCHGNHENYAGALQYATAAGARLGFRFLRGERAVLRFGQARLNLVGHDYQRMGFAYLPGAEYLVEKGALNLLLQHNPDVFPRAWTAGFDLVLSGHTHGGQVNFEIFSENVNLARVFTPYVKGLYEEGGSRLYVSKGLGTVGAPVRLGSPPEVTIIRLCAA